MPKTVISKVKEITYTPSELKMLFEAIANTPTWMSKKFVMIELLGWNEEIINKYHKNIDEDLK